MQSFVEQLCIYIAEQSSSCLAQILFDLIVDMLLHCCISGDMYQHGRVSIALPPASPDSQGNQKAENCIAQRWRKAIIPIIERYGILFMRRCKPAVCSLNVPDQRQRLAIFSATEHKFGADVI